jgi:hypothetical protein
MQPCLQQHYALYARVQKWLYDINSMRVFCDLELGRVAILTKRDRRPVLASEQLETVAKKTLRDRKPNGSSAERPVALSLAEMTAMDRLAM